MLLGNIYAQAQTALNLQGGGTNNAAATALVDNLVGQGVACLYAEFT